MMTKGGNFNHNAQQAPFLSRPTADAHPDRAGPACAYVVCVRIAAVSHRSSLGDSVPHRSCMAVVTCVWKSSNTGFVNTSVPGILFFFCWAQDSTLHELPIGLFLGQPYKRSVNLGTAKAADSSFSCDRVSGLIGSKFWKQLPLAL